MDFLKNINIEGKSEKKLWELVSEADKVRLERAINQTAEKTEEEKWPGLKWKLIVFRKHSYLSDRK